MLYPLGYTATHRSVFYYMPSKQEMLGILNVWVKPGNQGLNPAMSSTWVESSTHLELHWIQVCLHVQGPKCQHAAPSRRWIGWWSGQFLPFTKAFLFVFQVSRKQGANQCNFLSPHSVDNKFRKQRKGDATSNSLQKKAAGEPEVPSSSVYKWVSVCFDHAC